eukprot:14148206-Alexandrium_andersonii.AAC.1
MFWNLWAASGEARNHPTMLDNGGACGNLSETVGDCLEHLSSSSEAPTAVLHISRCTRGAARAAVAVAVARTVPCRGRRSCGGGGRSTC